MELIPISREEHFLSCLLSACGGVSGDTITLGTNTTVSSVQARTNTVMAQFSLPVNGWKSVVAGSTSICTHFELGGFADDTEHYCFNGSTLVLNIHKTNLSTLDVAGVKAYIAAEEAKGTPIKITYNISSICVELEPICRKEIFLQDLINKKRGMNVTKPTLEPIARIEHMLTKLLTGECDIEAICREECAVDCCASVEMKHEPIARKEHFWRAIAEKWE